MESILNYIQKTVGWYDKIPAGYNDIDMLINARRVLSTRLFQFAGIMADLRRNKGATELRRKAFENRRRYELKQSTEGKPIASHIEAQVLSESAEFLEAEFIAESEFAAAKLIFDSAMNICDVMNQHIANLRGEKSREMINQGA
jgi:hypothetical protein